MALGPHTAVFASFDGEFSRENQLYAGKGGFRYVCDCHSGAPQANPEPIALSDRVTANDRPQ